MDDIEHASDRNHNDPKHESPQPARYHIPAKSRLSHPPQPNNPATTNPPHHKQTPPHKPTRLTAPDQPQHRHLRPTDHKAPIRLSVPSTTLAINTTTSHRQKAPRERAYTRTYDWNAMNFPAALIPNCPTYARPNNTRTKQRPLTPRKAHQYPRKTQSGYTDLHLEPAQDPQ
jgi:hypothetical protein